MVEQLGHPDLAAGTASVGRRPAGAAETRAAQRAYWDGVAEVYQATNGAFLDGFVWCPEGLREEDAGLLGPVAGRRWLEIGCGGGQCAAWVARHGGDVVGLDLSDAQLRHAATPVVQADATALPFGARSFDGVFSAFGGVPFVADSGAVMREVARVLRPGGRWVFSVSHPLRWIFPDVPEAEALTVVQSYFDRTPYVEADAAGRATYVEHHRTLGDRVREITAAGLRLLDVVEPEWPEGQDRVWGQWSAARGALVPGTAIFVCVRD